MPVIGVPVYIDTSSWDIGATFPSLQQPHTLIPELTLPVLLQSSLV